MIIVGGGATGVGVAVDAASRGYDVLLLERYDFGKGTSSRSTKLIHGGVRYLEQGNVPLVMEALRERGLLRQNAPHLVHDLQFIVPNYDWWEAPFYGVGLKMYDLLAGRYGFGSSRLLSKDEILEELPTIKTDGLRGGVIYFDGQFDDSRLLINLMQTAVEHGAVALNYAQVVQITKSNNGEVNGVAVMDVETGREFKATARVVINATGAFVDEVRRLAESDTEELLALSQGIHLVFDKNILPSESAIMVPHTADGRVMFAIPWHGHIVVGTTDTPIQEAVVEPKPIDHEIEFILETAKKYLSSSPSRSDVRSVFVGIRPLVNSKGVGKTSALSREHTIHIDKSGLLTICGGKWTTYRVMAEDCVHHAALVAQLEERPCQTRDLKIHGFTQHTLDNHLGVYGADALGIEELIKGNPELRKPFHAALPYCPAEAIWAVRNEMALTVEDFLARRVRALFLNARAAIEMAPKVAQVMAGELGKDEAWQGDQVRQFGRLAEQYHLPKITA